MTDPKQSAEELFRAALDLPPERRSAFLDQACRDAPAIRLRVEQLLLAKDRTGSFLDRPLLKSDSMPGSTDPSLSPTTSQWSPLAGHNLPPRFRPPDVIANRFEVVRFIARGGMGEVYEVKDRFLQRVNLALKIIRPETAADPASASRFEQEVIVARRVNHPNLCPIYDIFRCEQPSPAFLFLTMKLLRGETLDECLSRSGNFPSAQAIESCRQLVRGVAALHDGGVIHRDLKPNNVILEQTGEHLLVSIMDFGLARPHELEKVTGVSVTIAGTLGYMAPELLRGQPPSKASDIFALGIVIHQVLTGQRPAESRTDSSMVALPALRSVQAPAHFVQAVPGLLSMEPEMRVRAFEQLRSAESGSTTSTLGRLYARRSKQIWFTAADGGPPEKLIATGTGEGMPSWAPDGTSVTFAYLDGHNQAVEGIYSLDLVTRRVSLMPRSTGLSAPSWSPDGKYLLALAKSPSRMMLYSAKTKVWSELRKGIAPPPYYWVWSKDSQYVYVRPDDAANAIYRLSILSGKWEKIGSLEGLRSRDGEGFLCLTADGRIAAMSHTAVAQIFSMRWKP